LGGPVEYFVDAVVDVVTDVVDWIAGAAVDVFNWVIDEIVAPVGRAVGNVLEYAVNNPIESIAKLLALSIPGMQWTIPLIDGAFAIAKGASLGSVLQTVAMSYIAQNVGREVGKAAAGFASDAVGAGLNAGVKIALTAGIDRAANQATQAIIYGTDPLKAFVTGGLSAAVAAGLGQLSELADWEEFEILDPNSEVGAYINKALPNTTKNMIGAALYAQLEGKEITPELMAGALTRGLITSELVKKFIGDDPNVSEQTINIVTAGFQQTAALMLSGGTSDEYRAVALNALKSYSTAALHERIKNSDLGDLIGNTLDKISGDYQKVQDLAAAIDEKGIGYTKRRKEYLAKYNARQNAKDEYNAARDVAINLRDNGGSDAAKRQAQENLNAKSRAYAQFVTDDYETDLAALRALVVADNEELTASQAEIRDAQINLNVSTDRADKALLATFELTNKDMATFMDPGFKAEEYITLNNLPSDTDAYAHYLSVGSRERYFTNEAHYRAATENAINTALSTMIYSRFGTEENSLARKLGSNDIAMIRSTLKEAGYDSPETIAELLGDFNKQKEILDTFINTYDTDKPLTAEDITILTEQGYDMSKVAVGAKATAQESLALDLNYKESNSTTPPIYSKATIADGVRPLDIYNGTAQLVYTENGATFVYPEEFTSWDPETGTVTSRPRVGVNGVTVRETTSWDAKNYITILIEEGQVEVAFAAADEGETWTAIAEWLGWDTRTTELASSIYTEITSMTPVESSLKAMINLADGNSIITNAIANIIKVGGGTAHVISGMATLAGVVPADTAVGKFAAKMLKLGAATNTDKYKKEYANLVATTNKIKVPDDAPWADHVFATLENYAGALTDHPMMFLTEYILVELPQELIPLAVGGVATLGAKGAALAMGKVLSKRAGKITGVTAAIATDLLESYGGTAAGTYDRAYNVAINVVNPETGKQFTVAEAEKYAMKLAVQSGLLSTGLTAATLGFGGAALEKLLLGGPGSGRLGENLLALALKGGLDIAKATGKEAVAEAVEEGAVAWYVSGRLNQIDRSIIVPRDVTAAAVMGALIGGPVSGSIATAAIGGPGIVNLGNLASNILVNTNADVNAAMQTSGVDTSVRVSAVKNVLTDLGVTDPITITNVLSLVDPDNYTSQANSYAAFTDSNPLYVPTVGDVNSFAKEGDSSTLTTDVASYVDVRYVDVGEIQAAAAAQGNLTLSTEEAEQYVGQGDANHEVAVLKQLTEVFDRGYTTEAEVRTMFEGMGYKPTDAEVALYTGNLNEAKQEAAVGKYVDPRMVSAEEVRKAYADLGMDAPTDADIEALTGQYLQSELAGKTEANLPTARYNSLKQTIDNLLASSGLTDADRASLNSMKVELMDSMSGLGVELARIDRANYELANNVGTPAEVDADGNEITASTGLYAAIDAGEAAGLTRDEATNAAIQALAEQSGRSDAEIRAQMAADQETTSSEIADLSSLVGTEGTETTAPTGLYARITDYEAAGSTRDEATNAAIQDLSNETGLSFDAISDQMAVDRETTSSEIEGVASLVGKPAEAVTPTDIDFVVDVIAGQQVMTENQLAQYDVNGDGLVTIDDQNILQQLYDGDTTYTQLTDDSIYRPTGTYAAINDSATNLTNQIDQNLDTLTDLNTQTNTKIDQNLNTTLDTITEMQSNINTNMQDEARRAGGRQFLQQAMQSSDVDGQQVSVKTPDPVDIDYFYDFNTIFANPEQDKMFPSPYAKGGQVEDTTDKLLRMIGGL
tara:strand:- start:5971 stop:11214 length:5244 start_codon:yes stop_codon:yes gene_type:complete